VNRRFVHENGGLMRGNPSVFDRFRLEGRTALVVGAGPGIGAHVAKAFAEAGANVVVSARSADKVEALARDIRAAGGRALGVAGDSGKAEEVETLVDRAEREFGAVHILFYNAFTGSLPIDQDVFDGGEEEWAAAIAVNLMGPYRLSKRLAPGMKAQGYGSIINLLTCANFTPILPQLIYGSTKAGLHMMTRYLAKALGPDVRANCICPGSMSPDGNVNPKFAALLEKNAIKRTGLADEVVGAALLLASPASSYTTGQVIFCEGGRVGTIS
jgi:NAD(P)-dependent dehydrogenase (short-subunit alcohol dehydrogenase family)